MSRLTLHTEAHDRRGPLEQVETALVETALRKTGGGVRVAELAYQTGLSESQVTDALCELEDQGRATPWAWTLGPESKQ